jgi:hypothetical protein
MGMRLPDFGAQHRLVGDHNNIILQAARFRSVNIGMRRLSAVWQVPVARFRKSMQARNATRSSIAAGDQTGGVGV